MLRTLAMSPTLAALALTLFAVALPVLAANDHDVGRTFIFDVNDPLHPKVVTSPIRSSATHSPATGAACQPSWAISLWKASRRFTASSS
jgi:hypothetical protein